ncbi:hypothetical protein IV203_006059 [Nitzschia inconspicua]|uniref:Fe2OG dioxygenase domain-containing protein n=1 Tax=Nitzschia inconspicua TaxID=303405 RepID=A0A9K3PH41_9STRA|nr:hypothetical protein IV203_006059 [Nitzschia inconspicua]
MRISRLWLACGILQPSFGFHSQFPHPLFERIQHEGSFPMANCQRRQQRTHSTTTLWVSELHVPAYAESKLPFILTEEDMEQLQQSNIHGGQLTLQRLQEQTYTANSDYESLIPYQDGFLLHKTKVPIFNAHECQQIIDEAEFIASQIEWTRNRHGNYPTTDLPLVELPQTLKFLKVALVQRIYPLLRSQFGMFLPDPNKLRLADGFVVKYDADQGQKELKPHRDGSVLSFNIALNPASEFEGGGTWFASLDAAVKIDQGEIVSHSSALLHGGHGITSGKRYILVGFVILEEYAPFSMRFYNQVRNL